MSDWIEWKGGECPVPAGTWVALRFHDEDWDNVPDPESWNWGEDDMPILAYRIHKESAN